MLRLGTVILCSAMCVPAFGQRYPAKPVRLIVASAPGGGIDTTARTLATKMTEIIGQSVLVENRAGASGIIGSERVGTTPKAFADFLQEEIERWAKVVKSAGIRAE